MILNHVKLGRTITFMKNLAKVVSLIFQPKTLIWNKIMLRRVSPKETANISFKDYKSL